eukprot:4385476-Amphidinium_carterae.1
MAEAKYHRAPSETQCDADGARRLGVRHELIHERYGSCHERNLHGDCQPARGSDDLDCAEASPGGVRAQRGKCRAAGRCGLKSALGECDERGKGEPGGTGVRSTNCSQESRSREKQNTPPKSEARACTKAPTTQQCRWVLRQRACKFTHGHMHGSEHNVWFRLVCRERIRSGALALYKCDDEALMREPRGAPSGSEEL